MQLAKEELVLGSWFEEFEVGQERVSAARTVTESDILLFAGMTGDNAQVHTDEEYGRKMLFGGRIAHGLLGLSFMQGLMGRTNYTQGTGVASVGWDKISFVAPIKINDTIRARWSIKEARASKSRPEVGILTEACTLENQRGEIVMRAEHGIMIKRRPK